MTSLSDTNVSVIALKKSGTVIHCTEQHSDLLAVLEFYKIPVEFQCREGFCGSCRIKLTKGKVHYTHAPIAFIQRGEILPCCCRPLGSIEIEL